jgi:RNA polymerase sigma factor (TIGR02999 family)
MTTSVMAIQSNGTQTTTSSEFARLLARVRQGEREAFDRLFEVAYRQLHRLAHNRIRVSGPQVTLDTTGLVHETYLKLAGGSVAACRDSEHFLAVAACAMRHVMIDFARRRLASKRGGERRDLTLDTERFAVDDQAEQLFEMNRQLERLAAEDSRLVQVIECRFFAGMSEPETAAALGTSVSTVQRDWVRARAWFATHCAADAFRHEA